MNKPKLLWKPSEEFIGSSNLTRYSSWLNKEYGLTFEEYHELWSWSIDNSQKFWKSIAEYFKIIFHSPYQAIHSDDPMPETIWFKGATLNYAEHIFRNANDQNPAIIFKNEKDPKIELSWKELKAQVASLAIYFKRIGLKKGDCIVAFLPNIPEATVGFLAANSIGAIWSSCSPDFGSSSVIDRFKQIEPKLLITVDGYQYNGKIFDRKETIKDIISQLPSIEKNIIIPYLDENTDLFIGNSVLWSDALSVPSGPLNYEPVEFDHPIWVLYSSGTTGQPKAITHSTGGMLMEHLKYITFHNDVQSGERFFWYTTTGWMMWNYVQATMLAGATIVLYDGSPAYPDLSSLWRFADEIDIHHFGTSAPFIISCMKVNLDLAKIEFKKLRSINSTGAPLPPEGFDWIYKNINPDLWLVSMSGGTDVCSAFVGGCPWEPVYEGEIQCRALGCDLHAYDGQGESILNTVGEMVIKKPMPCMPIYFWNDNGKQRYMESYFEMFPKVWRHGDWVLISDRRTLIIYGRSDATLNRHGIRIGTAEIYREVDKIDEIQDSIIINVEKQDGSHYMPLFVVMKIPGSLNQKIMEKIKLNLKEAYTSRHVPDEIIEIHDIPYTISGKKMEAPLKKIFMGVPIEEAANLGAMKNPDSLKEYADLV